MHRIQWLAGATVWTSIALAAVGRAAPADPIKPAIDRGVAALKELRKAEAPQGPAIGGTALWGLTLLECDVPAKDPAIQKAAVDIRKASADLTHTYSVALSILFLDRLGDANDVYLIQALTIRLLAGQNSAGGWGYDCPRPAKEEIQRLTSHIQRNSSGSNPQATSNAPSSQPKEPSALPEELREQLKALAKARPAGQPGEWMVGGDNSNTQFALMGLWVGRRHGVPADKALAAAEARFRKSQNGDGGWGYLPVLRNSGGLGTSTASMTCAGLLGLAMSHGAANESVLRTNPNTPAARLPKDPTKDAAVRSALMALGTVIGPAGGPKQNRAGRGPVLSKGFYFLWSMERVAVAYGLNTIGNKDWHAWGCEMLLSSQRQDGTWQGEYGAEIDTCFALLFLRRANLTQDLTATLKGHIKDPGEVTLKAGGVGGEGLIAKGLQTGIVWGDNADVSSAPLPKDLDPEAARLCETLLKAPADRQPQLIDQLKGNKGLTNTDALAAAIPRLPAGAARTQARDALAERLTRMTANTLRGKLTEEDVEVRVAAIRACATKEDKAHVPDLMALLEDAHERVARAAHVALKSMTGQDFGPASNATPADRSQAVAAWKTWWQKQASR